MIGHPLVLAILLVDLCTLALLAFAAVISMKVVLYWAPASAARGQIALEARSEAAVMAARGGGLLFLFSTILLIVAIALVLPLEVPGAMCGTGVLQAMRGQGGRALALRALAGGGLYIWWVLQGLNEGHPESPLAVAGARALLIAFFLAAVAVLATFDALGALRGHEPVSCCAVVYDSFRSLAEAQETAGLPQRVWLAGYGLGAVLLLGLARGTPGPGRSLLLALISLAWPLVAGLVLLRILAAYHYGVLHHHCPWCLFLPQHRLVGYPLFGSLVALAMEGLAMMTARAVKRRVPVLIQLAEARLRRGGRAMVVLTLLFLAFSILPALIWRLRFGVWLDKVS